jgi:hypothetical protein
MGGAPEDVRGEEHQAHIYIALLGRSDQMKVHNRDKYQTNAEKETTCIVVTGLMPAVQWREPSEVQRLEADTLKWCTEFGHVEACVVPPPHISGWTKQIFVAFKDFLPALKARNHFATLVVDGIAVIAEVGRTLPANLPGPT